jgi:hypothetical protein
VAEEAKAADQPDGGELLLVRFCRVPCEREAVEFGVTPAAMRVRLQPMNLVPA